MTLLAHTLSGNSNAKTCLVFIHGFSCAAGDWENQVAFFAKDYQTLTLDLRGHGASAALHFQNQYDMISLADDVIQLITALHITKEIVLIGHSMASRIVCEIYVQMQEKIQGIVLIDCGYQTVKNPVQENLFKDGYRTMMDDFFSQTFTEHTPQAVREKVMYDVYHFSEQIGRALFPNIQIYDYYALKKCLRLITVPLLILQATLSVNGKRYSLGTIDAPSAWLELIQQNVKHASIKIVSGSGHFIMLEKPDITNTLIADFLITK